MRINADRLRNHFEQMSRIGRFGETGVCRPTMSKLEKEAFTLAGGWMEEAGMKVRIDHFGNLIGRLEGKNPEKPVIMLGSHLDSQPNGGRFDGTAGVLAAIETVTALTENGVVPDRPIEVVSFADEEGWRFNKGLFGSRGINGRLEEGELFKEDQEGITREQALRAFGCDPERLAESVYPPGQVAAYLELHIEQGPILEKMDKPVGVVSGISGPLWLTVIVKGFAGHAGSVPMNSRQDALAGAAEMVVIIHEIARQNPDVPAVGTVGQLLVQPNSRNVIPEQVEFTIDLRDIDQDRRDMYEAQIRECLQITAEKRDLSVEIREEIREEPRYCSAWIKNCIKDSCKEKGLEAPELMSGPFHDALLMSYACDYGMIFVRCKDGISHNPAEFASYEDLAEGTDVMYGTLLKMLEQVKSNIVMNR
ncbi:Zn-dependent hydrolase [Bacillus massiliglaciei]|uniref:Zn-dependent hydrolase n=1 Tax=Bacillus massiliglaciei TaxID=1816693 RepID=UPI000B0E07BA|nr:Zn-dependent hydrolase [Bacillus massiliglaciei]